MEFIVLELVVTCTRIIPVFPFMRRIRYSGGILMLIVVPELC